MRLMASFENIMFRSLHRIFMHSSGIELSHRMSAQIWGRKGERRGGMGTTHLTNCVASSRALHECTTDAKSRGATLVFFEETKKNNRGKSKEFCFRVYY